PRRGVYDSGSFCYLQHVKLVHLGMDEAQERTRRRWLELSASRFPFLGRVFLQQRLDTRLFDRRDPIEPAPRKHFDFATLSSATEFVLRHFQTPGDCWNRAVAESRPDPGFIDHFDLPAEARKTSILIKRRFQKLSTAFGDHNRHLALEANFMQQCC